MQTFGSVLRRTVSTIPEPYGIVKAGKNRLHRTKLGSWQALAESKRMRHRKIAAHVYLLLAASLAIYCTKGAEKQGTQHSAAEHTPPNWKFTLSPGDAAEGKKLFVELECYKCHQITGESFPVVDAGDKGIGPELSQMAGMHPPEFFAESIVNPNAVIDVQDKEMGFLGPDGKSRMPTYSDVLTVKQVSDLATYLNSLKRDNHSGHR